jgi:hypothetical protein
MAWRKWLLAAAGLVGLAGCADYPYYGGYAYNDAYYNGYGYNGYPAYAYNNYPGYYAPYYGPSVSLGLAYSNRDEEHHWRHR